MNKHALLMLVCCLVPLALVGVVVASGVNLGGILPFAIMLLCPLLHILMMRGMGHDHTGHDGHAGHAGHKAGAPSADSPTPACHGDPQPLTAEPPARGR